MRGTAVALCLCLIAAPLANAQQAWDQKQVSSLVDEFVALLGKIQIEVKKTGNVASDEAREFVLDDLGLLRKNARQLQQGLNAGQDRTRSWPKARRCEMLIERVRTHAAEAGLTPSNTAHIDRAEELIDQIGAFYAMPGT